jgi:hypothetical protein
MLSLHSVHFWLISKKDALHGFALKYNFLLSLHYLISCLHHVSCRGTNETFSSLYAWQLHHRFLLASSQFKVRGLLKIYFEFFPVG